MSTGWDQLDSHQVGRYGEYAMKMALARLGCEIYVPEIDDHGVDLLFRRGGSAFHEVQVKTASTLNYRYVVKSKFPLRERFYYGLVLLIEERPACHLIPSRAWVDPQPPLVSRDYETGKSPPEYGILLGQDGAVEALREYRVSPDHVRLLTTLPGSK